MATINSKVWQSYQTLTFDLGNGNRTPLRPTTYRSFLGHISWHLLNHQVKIIHTLKSFKTRLLTFLFPVLIESVFVIPYFYISDKTVWVSFTTALSLIWVRPGPLDWVWHNGGWLRGCGGTRWLPQRSGVSTPAPWQGPSSPPPSRPGWGSSRCILTRSVSARQGLFYRSFFGIISSLFWQFSWLFETKIKGLIFAWIRLGTLLISGVISLILSITLAAGGDWREWQMTGGQARRGQRPQWLLSEINRSPGPAPQSQVRGRAVRTWTRSSRASTARPWTTPSGTYPASPASPPGSRGRVSASSDVLRQEG